jgi:hypothetical protein
MFRASFYNWGNCILPPWRWLLSAAIPLVGVRSGMLKGAWPGWRTLPGDLHTGGFGGWVNILPDSIACILKLEAHFQPEKKLSLSIL